MNQHRSLESIQDDISEIRQIVRKATGEVENAMESLNDLYGVDSKERWLRLHQAAGQLLDNIRIAENRTLQPLQAEYQRARNNKWRR